MDTGKKLFAFKLADKQAAIADEDRGKWKLRDGIAGAQYCTGSPPHVPGVLSGSDFHYLPC